MTFRSRATAGRLARSGALLAFLTVGAVAAPSARSEPVLRRVTARAENARLAVTVETSLSKRGRAVVTGTVNGRRIRATKAIRAGERSSRITIDPRRARVRRSTAPLEFDLTVRLIERRTAVEEQVTATVGVPLIVLPGLGNELTPGGMAPFLTALDLAAGGAWGVDGTKPTAQVVEYPSLDQPLTDLARGVDAAARKALKGSVFRQVDVVGYSMGGLVAREWMRRAGKGRVRRLVFLGTPNEGAPIAFLGVLAAETGVLDQVVANAGGGALSDAVSMFLDDRRTAALVTFLPTYDWASASFLPGFPATTIPVETLNSLVLGTDSAPLEALNAVPPEPNLDVHAFYYSSVPTETLGFEVGTIDRVDVTPLLAGLAGGLDGGALPDLSGVDLATLATGEGDGVVPAHSVRMEGVPGWRDRVVPHDLGAGLHVTLPFDPRVFTQVAAVLTQ